MTFTAYISVLILFFINLINYMDRFTIAGVLEHVENFYDLSDGGGGLLQTAFVLSYMITAPVFGYLGDRYSRKYLIAGGVLFWSTTTFIGSLIPAGGTGWFFFFRALVGTGEASYSTIAPTLIADLFPRSLRTKMLAFFYFAIPVGSGLGYVIGSGVAALMNQWQWALRVTPVLGIVSVILVLIFLREPPRGHSDGVGALEKTSLKEDLRYLLTVRTYIWSTIGFTCVCFAIGALSWWAPTYMLRAYNIKGTQITMQEVSLNFGIITCIGGIAGVMFGTFGAQYYRNFNQRADPLVCAIGVLGGVPFVFLGLVLADKSSTMSWIFIFIGITFLCMNWALVADMLLYVVVPNRRSMAQAMQILASHLLGDASSPFIVGAISDGIQGGDESPLKQYLSLQYALYITAFVLVIGGATFFYTSYFIVADQELCKLQSQEVLIEDSSQEPLIIDSEIVYRRSHQV